MESASNTHCFCIIPRYTFEIEKADDAHARENATHFSKKTRAVGVELVAVTGRAKAGSGSTKLDESDVHTKIKMRNTHCELARAGERVRGSVAGQVRRDSGRSDRHDRRRGWVARHY